MSELPPLPRRDAGATVPWYERDKKPPTRFVGRASVTVNGTVVTVANDDEVCAQLLDGLRRWEPAHA
jgi:hypothetical protein